MLLATLGVVAALAFVLGLGALCLWALKRWGRMSLTSRTRIAVEVVQRIPLGPKTGLAVVRVGEKVMAVSVGDGGIRTLFELDEADRQRVIASSQVPTPMDSSQEAMASFAKFVPGAFGRSMAKAMAASAPAAASTPAPVTVSQRAATFTSPVYAPVHAPVHAPVAASFSPTEAREIPSFITAPVTGADREFRRMLGGALSGATRLAVFTGAMVLAAASASTLRAQAAPPTNPPGALPTTVTAPALDTTKTTVGATTAPAILPLQPKVGVTPASVAGVSTAPATTPQTRKTGNGASIAAGGTRATRPMTQMRLDSAATARNDARAGAATPAPIGADEAIMRMLPQMDVQLGNEKEGGLRLNGTVGIVVMMGLLTLLPTLLLMMTGFTRILIVLHFLKQAMGTQSAPPAQLLGAMALLLTGFVMAPTLREVNNRAVTPWLDGKITQVEMMKTGVVPMREFMLKQTRESDLKTFIEMSRLPRPNTADDVPLHVLMSAFVASELRTAFQIGFAIYLPFIIIDAVVASVLMSMGMFMLPPAMISLPFKLLLFVLVDGWSLTISSLVQSFK